MLRERPNIEAEMPVFEDDLDGVENLFFEEEAPPVPAVNEEIASRQAAEDTPAEAPVTPMDQEAQAIRVPGKVTRKLTADSIRSMVLQQAAEIVEQMFNNGAFEESAKPTGGTGMLYKSIEHSGFSLIDRLTGEIHNINGAVKVGRNANHAELVPEGNNTVSSEHAIVTDREGTLLVQDLDSTNGTFVNGKKILPNQNIQISKGDIVTFSNAEYVVGDYSK